MIESLISAIAFVILFAVFVWLSYFVACSLKLVIKATTIGIKAFIVKTALKIISDEEKKAVRKTMRPDDRGIK